MIRLLADYGRPGMLALALVLTGCGSERPARTVSEFLDDPIGLEATLVRCNADRGRLRDDPECINAREANDRLANVEEQEQLRLMEIESQRKRDAIRRRNEAAAEAARQAELAAEQREQFLYEQQFEQQPSNAGVPGNVAGDAAPVEFPAGDQSAPEQPRPDVNTEVSQTPAPDEQVEQDDGVSSDLSDLREELNRRNQSGESPPPNPQ